jgi:sugar lactone lactonase YvrE
MRPIFSSSASTMVLLAFAATASAGAPDGSSAPETRARAPLAGEPRSFRAERLLDREWLRAHGIETPSKLAFDDAGALYVLDVRDRRVVRIPLGASDGDRYGDGGPAAERYGEEFATSWLPSDLVVDLRGSILVLDRAAGSVVALSRRGEALGDREIDPSLREEARASGARLLRDPYGELWLLSPRERDLVSLDSRLRRRRVGRFLVPEESIEAPVAAAFLPRGGGWIADGGRGILRRFETTGRISATARAADSIAFMPTDVATDATGSVFAADAAGCRVIAFEPGGRQLATHWLSGGARAWRPAAIAWSPNDRVAVADPERGEIWILSVEREGSP